MRSSAEPMPNPPNPQSLCRFSDRLNLLPCRPMVGNQLLRLHDSGHTLSPAAQQPYGAPVRITPFRVKRQRTFSDELVALSLHAIFHKLVLISAPVQDLLLLLQVFNAACPVSFALAVSLGLLIVIPSAACQKNNKTQRQQNCKTFHFSVPFNR